MFVFLWWICSQNLDNSVLSKTIPCIDNLRYYLFFLDQVVWETRSVSSFMTKLFIFIAVKTSVFLYGLVCYKETHYVKTQLNGFRTSSVSAVVVKRSGGTIRVRCCHKIFVRWNINGKCKIFDVWDVFVHSTISSNCPNIILYRWEYNIFIHNSKTITDFNNIAHNTMTHVTWITIPYFIYHPIILLNNSVVNLRPLTNTFNKIVFENYCYMVHVVQKSL